MKKLVTITTLILLLILNIQGIESTSTGLYINVKNETAYNFLKNIENKFIQIDWSK